MNSLITSNNVTMSSREIADLVESRHADVCRTIERLMAGGIIQGSAPTAYTHPQNGQSYKEYLVGKRDSYVIVAQLSPEFTARLVDRWQELEEKNTIPQTLPEALRLAADLAEQKQQLENQLALAAPKVEFADRVSEASGILIGNYAKVVQLGQNKLFSWLRENGVLIASGSRRNVPKQEYMDRGYFTVKETAVNTNHGIHISFTTKITGRGQQWLTRKLVDCGLLKAVGDAA
ncbi:MAG: phage antirepressor KilAC domain-containing protein [Enterobacteriaceae bacterium]|nr:phage antirepressor KilAC domain-containing protein [Enterobacteriaceae bacterium]